MRIEVMLLNCALLFLMGGLAAAQDATPDDREGSGVIEASAPARRRGPYAIDPKVSGIGRTLSPLAWRDLSGRPGRLGRAGARRGTVIALTDTSCPLTQKFAPSLARLDQDCAERGLELLLLNTSEGEELAELKAWVAKHELDVPYVHDPSGELARELGAQTTTDCFLIDAAGRLVYRGALSDQYGLGYALDEPRERYLLDAMEAMLSGETPEVQATWAPGCVLGLTPREALEPDTWNGRISRIVRTRCASCHQDGGVAPFALETRAQVERKKGMLGFVLEEGLMPPWTASKESGPWSNDGSLPNEERDALLAWLAAGLPEGDPATALPPMIAAPDEWRAGTPDAIFALPEEQPVQAEGVMEYVRVLVDTKFGEDRWVQSMEIRPTDRAVVHHVVIYLMEGGHKSGRRGGQIDETTGFFAGYVPGNGFNVLPPGFARKLPAGAQLLFEMHYTPNGVATTDRSRLGLVFADAPPEHEVKSFGIANTKFEIPAGEPHHEVQRRVKLPEGIGVLALMPHMHLRGDAVNIDAKRPKEARFNLLSVPRYDFNWQFAYRFVTPVELPKGSRIEVKAWFDNSAANPANPDPSRNVTWGDQTTDEMMIGYVEYYEL